MDKPHLSKFVFESFDPVHEAGKQARWYGVLAEFQKGSDGVYRKVLSGELTLAQLEAQGFKHLDVEESWLPKTAMARAEAAEAQLATARNERAQAFVERDVAREDMLLAQQKAASLATKNAELLSQNLKLADDLATALGARDDFAALEKSARASLTAANRRASENTDFAADTLAKLYRIPRLIRRLFGAI